MLDASAGSLNGSKRGRPVIPTPEEQPTLTVEEAGRWCGLGRDAAYEAVQRGELPVLHFGRSLPRPDGGSATHARHRLGTDTR